MYSKIIGLFQYLISNTKFKLLYAKLESVFVSGNGVDGSRI